MFKLASSIVVLSFMVCAAAHAQQVQQYPTYDQPAQPVQTQQSQPGQFTAPEYAPVQELEHTGFHAHAMLGIGGQGGLWSYEGNDLNVYGASMMLGFSGGYAVVPNLIIGADLDLFFGLGHKWKYSGDISDASGDATATYLNFGPSLVYYVMPSNVFFTGSIGVAAGWLVTKNSGTDTDLKPGFAFKLGLGREWDIGYDIGLGVAGYVNFMTFPVDNSDGYLVDPANANVIGGFVAFSASWR